jgi:hypothetical protein
LPCRYRQIGLEAATEVGAVAVTGLAGAQVLAGDAVTFELGRTAVRACLPAAVACQRSS